MIFSPEFNLISGVVKDLDSLGIGGVVSPWYFSPYQGVIIKFLSGKNKNRVIGLAAKERGEKEFDFVFVDGETKDFDSDYIPRPNGDASLEKLKTREELLEAAKKDLF